MSRDQESVATTQGVPPRPSGTLDFQLPQHVQLPPLQFPLSQLPPQPQPQPQLQRTQPPLPIPLPRPPTHPLPPRDAIQALLHTPLTVSLTDGREVTGTLSAVDRHSLLLLNARERRVLSGSVGRNVGMWYPFSREREGEDGGFGGDENGEGEGEEGGETGDLEGKETEYTRVREVSSVLVRFEHVLAVRMSEENAEDWGRFVGVAFEGGKAV